MAQPEEKTVTVCKHCGRAIEVVDYKVQHDNGLVHCMTWESDQPFGLKAEL